MDTIDNYCKKDNMNKLSELQYREVKMFLNKYVKSINCLTAMMIIRIEQINNEFFTKDFLETNNSVICCFNKLNIFHMQSLENLDHIDKILREEFKDFEEKYFPQNDNNDDVANTNQCTKNDNATSSDTSLDQVDFLLTLNLQQQKETSVFPPKDNEFESGLFSQSTEIIETEENERNIPLDHKDESKSDSDEDIDLIIDSIVSSGSDEEFKTKCKKAMKQILEDSLSSDSEIDYVERAGGKIVNILDMVDENSNHKSEANEQKKYDSEEREIMMLTDLSTLNKKKRLLSGSSDNMSSENEESHKKSKVFRKKKRSSSIESVKSTSSEDSFIENPIIPNEIQSDKIEDVHNDLNGLIYLSSSSDEFDEENDKNKQSDDTSETVINNENCKEDGKNKEKGENEDVDFSGKTEIIDSVKKNNDTKDIEVIDLINDETNEHSVTIPQQDKTQSDWRNDSLLHGNLDLIENTVNKKSKETTQDIEFMESNSNDSIIFCEEQNITKIIQKSVDIPQKRTRKVISPEIILSSDDTSENDDDDQEITELNSSQDGKGRKNIRAVISDDFLLESTKQANREEEQRLKRLSSIYSDNFEIESQRLSEGIVPETIILEYDVKTKKPHVQIDSKFYSKLKEHQKEGIKFMWDSCFESTIQISKDKKGTGCILAHCMGLGKTLQVIVLIHTLLSNSLIKRVLVIAPSNTVINWKNEFNLWLKDVNTNFQVHTLLNSKEFPQRASILSYWFRHGGVLILSYTMFCVLLKDHANIRPDQKKKIEKALLNPGPDLIICDEGHILKNSKTLKCKLISRIRTGRKIMLTGTPMQNNLKEYYCMVNIIKPNLLGTYLEYSNRFVNPILNGQHQDSSETDIKQMKKRSHVLHKLLSGVVQRYGESVLHPFLPPLLHYIVFVRLSSIQNDLYKECLKSISSEVKVHQKSVLSIYNVMKRIWTHPRSLTYAENKQTTNTLINLPNDWWKKNCPEDIIDNLNIGTKLQILCDILIECEVIGDKIVVFSTSLDILKSVEYFIQNGEDKTNLKKNWRPGVDYYRIDGSISTDLRSQYIDKFNDENNKTIKMILASTKACGQGVNMIGANRIVTLDTPWNPADDMQSIFRIYRLSQKKTCYIYSLVAMGTMEQKIYERSVTKQAIACRVVDERQINRHYIKNDILELYKYTDLGGLERPAPKLPVDRILATMIQKHSNLVWSYHEHKKLLQNLEDEELDEQEQKAAWEEFQLEENDRFKNLSSAQPITTLVTNRLLDKSINDMRRDHNMSKTGMVLRPLQFESNGQERLTQQGDSHMENSRNEFAPVHLDHFRGQSAQNTDNPILHDLLLVHHNDGPFRINNVRSLGNNVKFTNEKKNESYGEK